jgi:hypothetical protein
MNLGVYGSEICSLRSIINDTFGFKYKATKVQRQPCRVYNHLYTNEETLLPLLRLNPRPLQDRIRAGNADPLRGGRTLQVQHARLSEFLPRGLQRIADGEEDSAAHEKWWFAWLNVS